MSLLWTPFPRPLLLTCQSYLKHLPPFHGWVSPGLLDWVGSSGLAGIASYSCVPSSWVQGLLRGDLALSSQIKQASLFLLTCPGPLSDDGDVKKKVAGSMQVTGVGLQRSRVEILP